MVQTRVTKKTALAIQTTKRKTRKNGIGSNQVNKEGERTEFSPPPQGLADIAR